ncbi:ATP-binding protein [Parasphingorhabdus cellanae]|uniref:DUF87 domain-containing protein n=1 Tax=Parasphingorhabdus cellanae TaxID=2806553 RepID=A0ABX7T7Y3_9SPHN|nr:DUF87 domain-containing protein [Parasphingorhabdus cellanae]QTD57616.1 DUF87 domain-containing protein [Parasphingorhabdus cellanae]
MTENLSQKSRFLAFGINGLIFYILYIWVTGHFAISAGGQSVWFISAIGWWTLSLISAPFYRPPRDAIGAAVVNIVALVTLDLEPVQDIDFEIEIFRFFAIVYSAIVGVAALTAAMFAKDRATPLGRFAFDFAAQFSNGAVLFGMTALISIFGFYADATKIFLLTLFWLGFALLKPVEFIIAAISKWVEEKSSGEFVLSGELMRVDDPDIVRVRLTEDERWIDDVHIALMPNGSQRYVLPLFSNVQNDEIMGTGLLVGAELEYELPKLNGRVFKAFAPELREGLLKELSGPEDQCELVGFVVEGSEISEIKFEIALGSNLTKGSVLFCIINETAVYYQIMNANTAEESFQQNPRGTHIVSAVQLGTWSDENGFSTFSWLPKMNLPVFMILEERKFDLNPGKGEFELGHIPNTDIKTKGFLPDLIGYHTAILGVTGTGKTELVFDLIEESLHQDTKVICVDLTGEYRKRLAHLKPEGIGLTTGKSDELESKIFDVDTGKHGAKDEKRILKEFQDKIRAIARKQIDTFLCASGPKIGLFELAEVTNTNATLLATEIYLSEVMKWARAHRKSRRILIVLEEAHTIIPETSGSGLSFATQAVVSKIGQIALQGRKYGVGLFIVSQRTALVSKTVLSQCNTFLTHNLVDQTSLSFLMNIYDAGYVKAIPNLKFLEFIAFGKGVIGERPLLLKRNFDQGKKEASAKLDEFMDINTAIETVAQKEAAAKEAQPEAAPSRPSPAVSVPTSQD